MSDSEIVNRYMNVTVIAGILQNVIFAVILYAVSYLVVGKNTLGNGTDYHRQNRNPDIKNNRHRRTMLCKKLSKRNRSIQNYHAAEGGDKHA